MAAVSGRPIRIALVGGPEGLAERAGIALAERHSCEIVYTSDGFRTDWDPVIQAIKDASPDIVFVGMGSPREKLWVIEHTPKLSPMLGEHLRGLVRLRHRRRATGTPLDDRGAASSGPTASSTIPGGSHGGTCSASARSYGSPRAPRGPSREQHGRSPSSVTTARPSRSPLIVVLHGEIDPPAWLARPERPAVVVRNDAGAQRVTLQR